MYSYFKGEIAELSPEGIVLECGGIGYNIEMPMAMVAPYLQLGTQAKIYTYFSVKEDAMKLYGFLTKDEVELFKLLISVNGVGPKAGLNILSTLSADEVRFAILADDAKTIARAQGIGKKIAERIVLELKGKFDLDAAFHQAFDTSATASGGSGAQGVSDANISAALALRNEIIEALTALGSSAAEAAKVAGKLDYSAGKSTEELLKEAVMLTFA